MRSTIFLSNKQFIGFHFLTLFGFLFKFDLSARIFLTFCLNFIKFIVWISIIYVGSMFKLDLNLLFVSIAFKLIIIFE